LNSYGIALVKKAENCILHPYLDSGNKPTIGWGNTFWENGTPVEMTDKPITQARADQLFDRTINSFYLEVKKAVKSSRNENELSALASLAYNIGMPSFLGSSLLKLVNAKAPIEQIEKHWNEWKYDNGKVVKGLVNRRIKEIDLFKKKIQFSMKKITDFIKLHKVPFMVVGGLVIAVIAYKKFKK
jgi:lysozyme